MVTKFLKVYSNSIIKCYFFAEEHCRKLNELRDYFLEEERHLRGWCTPEKKSLSSVNSATVEEEASSGNEINGS